MSFSREHGDKIVPERQQLQPLDILTSVIVGLQIVIAIGALPFLPASLPIHWGLNGQPDNYSPRWVGAFLFPAVSLGLGLLLRVLPNIGPRMGDGEHGWANLGVRRVIILGTVLFLFVLQVATFAQALGFETDILMVISLTLAIYMILIGNYMGKIRRNFWMGIRSPWALTSEVVWERTHRLGGWLFVACGILSIPLSFLPSLRLLPQVVLILLVCAFLYVYSYVCYRQVIQRQDGPPDPPFTHENI